MIYKIESGKLTVVKVKTVSYTVSEASPENVREHLAIRRAIIVKRHCALTNHGKNEVKS